MRTGRKLSSKNLRAASASSAPARSARTHTACSAPYIGRLSPGTRGARAIGRQLVRNVAKAAAWSSWRQPAMSLHATGAYWPSRIFSGPGTSGTGGPGRRCGWDLPAPRHLGIPLLGAPSCRGAAAAVAQTSPAAVRIARTDAILRASETAAVSASPSVRAGGVLNCAPRRSGARVGRHELPVGIARRDVARKGPDVSDVGDLVGIAVDHVAGLVARHRDELGHEPDRELRGAIAQLSGRDVTRVDRHEARLGGLAAGLAQ